MFIFWFILILLILLFLGLLGLMLFSFVRTFLTPPRKPEVENVIPVPEGRSYRPHHDKFIEWGKAVRAMSHVDVEIKSHDGLTLRGKYYEYEPGAPVQLLIHGYRGSAGRDLNSGVIRAFALGHNALVVDHRGCGRSDGHIITFGILESMDCIAWINYIIDYIDFSAKIIICGLSMGAATAMMTAARDDLPENVVGVIADCGFSCAKDVVTRTIEKANLPPELFYPLVRFSGKLFSNIDIEEASSIDAVKNITLPIIFFHGDNDKFIPCEMSVANFEECASENKKLVIIEGANHALSYAVNPSKYVKELKDFFDPILNSSED